jgi:hypothetical protein
MALLPPARYAGRHMLVTGTSTRLQQDENRPVPLTSSWSSSEKFDVREEQLSSRCRTRTKMFLILLKTLTDSIPISLNGIVTGRLKSLYLMSFYSMTLLNRLER